MDIPENPFDNLEQPVVEQPIMLESPAEVSPHKRPILHKILYATGGLVVIAVLGVAMYSYNQQQKTGSTPAVASASPTTTPTTSPSPVASPTPSPTTSPTPSPTAVTGPNIDQTMQSVDTALSNVDNSTTSADSAPSDTDTTP